MASPPHAAVAWQRMQAGGGQLAHMVLEAPTRAPMQIFGVTFLIAMMLSQTSLSSMAAGTSLCSSQPPR
eukprot:2592563-Prymnesium_polylepis.1